MATKTQVCGYADLWHPKCMRVRSAIVSIFYLLSFIPVLVATGCASDAGKPPTGLKKPVAVSESVWSYDQQPGHILETQHYRVFTTIAEDDPLYSMLPQLMEGGWTQYTQVAPDAPPLDRKLDCYVFGTRAQWTLFTRQHTGPRAGIYLQIGYGAYALEDVFVAYDMGDYRTLPATAHEGWHQFAARSFKGKLPPFLEEGVATTFENVDTFHSLPEWNLQKNGDRLRGLRRSIEGDYLFPLEELVTLNAGDVIHRPGDRIEAFYSQCWAFARFLQDADDSKYKPAFRRLLVDVQNGTVWGVSPTMQRIGWDKRMVGPILEHYLGMSLQQIDERYQAYCKRIAITEFKD